MRDGATAFCHATKTQSCDPLAGHFALNVVRERRPGWLERALRSLVPITSPFL
jgi:hypothetical protein